MVCETRRWRVVLYPLNPTCVFFYNILSVVVVYNHDVIKVIVSLRCTIKIYDRRADFDFDIVNFPSRFRLDDDIPSSPSYGTYLSQLIRFARVCNKVEDFNDRNYIISRKLLKPGFLYHKLNKTFARLYSRHFDLVKQFNSSLINLIDGAISHPHFYFYGDFL